MVAARRELMGAMHVDGFNQLSISLEKLAAMPDNIMAEMLTAGAEVIKDAQQKKLEQFVEGYSPKAKKPKRTGQLAASLKIEKPNTRNGTITIRPSGTRKRGNTVTRNEEIGYITEYGKAGEPARPWMREANAEAEDKAVDAAAKPFEQYLDKIGL